jgi:DNA polymerase III delta prime subunit
MRIVEILDNENVKWEIDDLQPYIEQAYPDLRKCINMVQQGTVDGVLRPLKADDAGDVEYMLAVTDLFKQKRFLDGRRLIVEQARRR